MCSKKERLLTKQIASPVKNLLLLFFLSLQLTCGIDGPKNQYFELIIDSNSINKEIKCGEQIQDTIKFKNASHNDVTISVLKKPVGMKIENKIIFWKPSETAIGINELIFTATTAIQEHNDTFICNLSVKPSLQIDTNSFKKVYFADLNLTYLDTLKFNGGICDSSLFKVIQCPKSMTHQGFIFSFKPELSDTGTLLLKFIVGTTISDIDTFSLALNVKLNKPLNCSTCTFKNYYTIGNPAALPKGYIVFDNLNSPGLIASKIYPFKRCLIPNTDSDLVKCASISNDGEWIQYLSENKKHIYIIKPDGSKKTLVPNTTTDGFPTLSGFYRESPNGSEIYYLSNQNYLRAIKVIFSNDSVHFGNDRLVVDLDSKMRFLTTPLEQIAVAKNQIFGEIGPEVNGDPKYRSAFLTIPENGSGIAHSENVYKWLNDVPERIFGCGHTISFDGELCLFNPPYGIGSPECTPTDHKGFVIVPFFFDTSTQIVMQDLIDKHAISINWAPLEYATNADFWGWYFGNDRKYVIGRSLSKTYSGIWIVNWKENVWYPITRDSLQMMTYQPAVYWGNIPPFNCTTDDSLPVDTTTSSCPEYKVIYPNGGEQFYIGEPCTLHVRSKKDSHAVLEISINSGKSFMTLPGINNSIDPFIDSIFVFTIPDSFSVLKYDKDNLTTVISKKSSESQNCLIKIRDYNAALNCDDISDSCFSIFRKISLSIRK